MPAAQVNIAEPVRRAKVNTQSILGSAGCLALGGIYALIHVSGICRFGLGWAVRPGYVLLPVLAALTLLAFRGKRWRAAVQVLAYFGAAMSVECFLLPRPLDSFVGIALTLLGDLTLLKSAPRVGIYGVPALLSSAYVHSVFIFNLLRGEQMMFFFKQGWTL